MDLFNIAGLFVFAAFVFGVYRLIKYIDRKKTERTGAAGPGTDQRDDTSNKK